jgi:phospholipase/lecithinase/hemolysin
VSVYGNGGRLNNRLSALRTKYGAQIEIEMFDPNEELDDIVSAIGPEEQGIYEYETKYFEQNKKISLTSYKTPACTSKASLIKLEAQSIACQQFAENADNLVFADIVHPSAMVHEILADRIAAKLMAKKWA